MDGLPEDLIQLLLLQISPEEILSSCSVNMEISRVCNNDQFWHQVTNINWPEEHHKPGEITWKQFTLRLIKTTRLIPIYLRIDINNYKLMAKLRLYKDTSIVEEENKNQRGIGNFSLPNISYYLVTIFIYR